MLRRINELRENRSKAWEAAKNFLDTHQTENGTLSADDAATYDRMEAEVVNLGREIERQNAARPWTHRCPSLSALR